MFAKANKVKNLAYVYQIEKYI